jgi:hypothetical protein
MGQPETTVALMKEIDKGYDRCIALITEQLKQYISRSPERDILSILKRAIKRMHRVDPAWSAMHHGYLVMDDDQMGTLRVVFATDITHLLTGVNAPRVQMVIENIECTVNTPFIKGDGSDHFLDKVEICSPTIVRDMFFPINFIGHAETSDYITTHSEFKREGDDELVVIEMRRKTRAALRVTANLSAMFKDVQQLRNHEKELELRAQEKEQGV